MSMWRWASGEGQVQLARPNLDPRKHEMWSSERLEPAGEVGKEDWGGGGIFPKAFFPNSNCFGPCFAGSPPPTSHLTSHTTHTHKNPPQNMPKPLTPCASVSALVAGCFAKSCLFLCTRCSVQFASCEQPFFFRSLF